MLGPMPPTKLDMKHPGSTTARGMPELLAYSVMAAYQRGVRQGQPGHPSATSRKLITHTLLSKCLTSVSSPLDRVETDSSPDQMNKSTEPASRAASIILLPSAYSRAASMSDQKSVTGVAVGKSARSTRRTGGLARELTSKDNVGSLENTV